MIDLHLKYTRDKVPILRNSDIDDIAEAILRDFDPSLLTDPQEVDIEGLVECYMNLHTNYETLSSTGNTLGMMVFETGWIPVYDKERNERYGEPVKANTVVIDGSLLSADKKHIFRSTFGHEGGHFVFHSAYYLRNASQYSLPLDDAQKGFVLCCKKDIVGSETGHKRLKTDKDWIEHHARYFSASALMPRAAMNMLMSDCKSFSERALVDVVAKTFNVSQESAKYRITDLRRAQAASYSSQFSQALRQFEIFR